MKNLGVLREILDSEIELMRSWRNSPTIRANMYTRHEISKKEHSEWWKKTKKDQNKEYFIYELDEPQGVVGFSSVDLMNRNASWAFYAAPDAPRGTGTKMEFLALEHAFKDLKLHKLHCEVLSSNMQVIQFHKRFGFQIEGVFREHHLFSGNFIDIYRLGILTDEWSRQRNLIAEKLSNFAW